MTDVARTPFKKAIQHIEKALAALDKDDLTGAVKFALKADQETATALLGLANLAPTAVFLRGAIERAGHSTELSSRIAESLGLPPSSATALRPRLRMLAESLAELKDAVGPLQAPLFVFDPAGFDVIAHVAATALLAQNAHPLTERPTDWGSGIYALFYKGPLKLYEPLVGTKTPIYVGSAAPAVHTATTPEEQGGSLVQRVSEHRGSIEEVEAYPQGNLKVADFEYRYLVVKSGWELAAEQYLIRYFRPLWNKETKVCTGIGKHGDASTTRGNTRSVWDTVHPGRPWTLTPETKNNRRSIAQIHQAIGTHFERHPPRDLNIADILPLGETHPGISGDEAAPMPPPSDEDDDDES